MNFSRGFRAGGKQARKKQVGNQGANGSWFTCLADPADRQLGVLVEVLDTGLIDAPLMLRYRRGTDRIGIRAEGKPPRRAYAQLDPLGERTSY